MTFFFFVYFLGTYSQCWGSGSGAECMFLALPDPDPLVIEVWIRILPFSHKSVEQTEIMLARLNSNTKF
jgi:hypothetical protein